MVKESQAYLQQSSKDCIMNLYNIMKLSNTTEKAPIRQYTQKITVNSGLGGLESQLSAE